MRRWLPQAAGLLLAIAACGDDRSSGPTRSVTLHVEATQYAAVNTTLVQNVAGIEEKRAEYYFDDSVDVKVHGETIVLTIPDRPLDDALFEGVGHLEFHEPVPDGHGGVECGTREEPAGSARPEEIVASDDGDALVLVCAGGAPVALQPSAAHRTDGTVAALTGDFIDRATVDALDPEGGPAGPAIRLAFNPDGSLMFGEITSRVRGMPLAMVMDGVMVSAPTVQLEILGGEVVIGFRTEESARLMAGLLKYGELPASVTIIEAPSATLTPGG